MSRRFLLLLFATIPFLSSAQIISLKGSVVDSVTGEKLPFVTILINDQDDLGTSTDSAGNFSIKSIKPIVAVKVSYVGYNTKQFQFKTTDKTSALLIQLSPQHQELGDIMVVAGENPANRIIRQAVKHRDENNYAAFSSYVFTAYEKFTVTGIPTDSIVSDSLRAKLFRYLEDNHLMILESVVERKHLNPDLTKETVIAQKVSGLNNPNFTLLVSQLQTTNF